MVSNPMASSVHKEDTDNVCVGKILIILTEIYNAKNIPVHLLASHVINNLESYFYILYVKMSALRGLIISNRDKNMECSETQEPVAPYITQSFWLGTAGNNFLFADDNGGSEIWAGHNTRVSGNTDVKVHTREFISSQQSSSTICTAAHLPLK